MSDQTPSTQPGLGYTAPASGGPPAPPAQTYPGFPARPTQPQHIAAGQPAQPPYSPPAPQHAYGSAPGQVTQSPYAPHGQSYPVPHYATPRPTNGLALAALICGIVGIVFSPTIFFLVVPIVIPIAAVVLGHIALSQLKRTPGLGGRGMALTGLILGYVPIAVSLLGLLLLVIVTVSIGASTLPFVFAA